MAAAADYPHRKVVAVLWRRGNHMTLTYEDETTSLVVAAPGVAERIARDAGLVAGPSSEGELRWERPDP